MSGEPSGGKGPGGQLRLGRGDVVGERWRLDEFLKGGGMGRVWRATDLRLLEPVAVKLLDPAGLAADGARERFFREAQAAARLRGPNVVQVLDFDVDPATHVPYLAMELLHGEDLAERLARGPLTFPDTVALLADVCSAIARAHKLEIVHRDLKPANIFIVDGDDGPVCKVLDFGIVKLTTSGSLDGSLIKPEAQLTLSGATLGTVSYMSPEQIADAQRVDHRADLWSIGVLAYECLTGRRPFRGDSLLGLVHEVCYGTPTPPSRLAEVPPGFDRWFSRATHRDLSRRFASARELHDALKALDRPAAASTPAAPEHHREPAQSWVSDANQIDIGALKDLTFKGPVVREFLDGASRHFVSGSKGLGKTLLLTYKRALLSEHYLTPNPAHKDRRQPVQFIPEGRPYLDLMGDLPSVDHAQIERMTRLDECKRLWSFSFRLAILSHHPALLADPDDLAPLPRRLRGLLAGRPVEPTLVLKELLALSARQLSQTLDAMEAPLERRLRALHSGVFVFIDKLDQALRRLPRAAWVHMQAGMIEAAWDLMNANRHVKIFATIREEAFSGYESDIKTNLYGATSSLRYAKHELRELLEKLTYYYEGLPLYDFVLFDQVHASPGARGESPFDFLHRHTLGRPRDLVILASEVSRHRRGLDARAFIRVVQDTSAGLLVANIFDEMRVFLEVLSDRDRRAKFLALLPHDVLTPDDVADVWCAFHGVDRDYFDLHGRDADDVYHPFRELYECGLLGVLELGGTQRFRQPHDPVAGSRHELPRSPYYLLHPALRAMLERLAGAGRFRPLRHVLIGHGEPWPAHWGPMVDVQRELLRRPPDADTTDAVQALLDRLGARLASGDGPEPARRELAATPAFTRLIAQLERGGHDDLYLTLVDLFTPRRRDPEPSTAPEGRVLPHESHAHAETLGPTDRVEVAMLLVDIVRSTRLVLDLGDTNFVDHLHGLRSALRSSPALRFLKGTGDGYLAVFATTTRALAAARSLRAELRDPTHLRLVIHTGPVRLGDQDVFGSEVHRLFRIEALEQSDRADTSNSAPLQPGRITLSRPALAALPEPERAAFARAGSFRLKGFDEPEEVWVESEDIVAHPGE